MKSAHRFLIASAVVVSALEGGVRAQSDFDFAADQSNSNFTWSGTTNAGPLSGNPSNSFQLQGDLHLTLSQNGPSPLATGQLVGAGDLQFVPDLHGKIQNAAGGGVFATMDCVAVHLVASSPTFTISANGSFLAPVTLTITQGTLLVNRGVASQAPLVNYQSSASVQPGTITQVGLSVHLALPIAATFQFSVGGVTGSIDISGTLTANWNCPPPQVYCTAKTNSLGCLPGIATSGTAQYTGNSTFFVTATNELNQKNGLLFYGFSQASVPFQGGTLCVASPTIRTGVQSSGGSPTGNSCTGTYSQDFNSLIHGHTVPSLVPGKTVFAQYWSRDPQSIASTNLTNAARFVICP